MTSHPLTQYSVKRPRLYRCGLGRPSETGPCQPVRCSRSVMAESLRVYIVGVEQTWVNKSKWLVQPVGRDKIAED